MTGLRNTPEARNGAAGVTLGGELVRERMLFGWAHAGRSLTGKSLI